MDTILQLFHDHALIAISACVGLLFITVLPFTGSRFPRLLVRLATSLARVVTVPFSLWRRTVLDLAAGSGDSNNDGPTRFGRRLLPVMQSLLILGGLAILTAGVLSGWRASGITRESGHLKEALMTELPVLEGALADTRSRISDLDRDWEESRECHTDEFVSKLSAEALLIAVENGGLGDFLSRDRQTRDVFSVLAGGRAAGKTSDLIAEDLRDALPALELSPEKEWLFTRYLDNLRRESDLVRELGNLSDADVRRVHQPEIETLRRIEAELGPAIARVRADLAAPDQAATFDAAAFVGASSPALVLFCGFVWVVGGLIELMGSAVTLRGAVRATVNEEGHLKWAE